MSKSLVVTVEIFACNFVMNAGTAATLTVLRTATAGGTIATEISAGRVYFSRGICRSTCRSCNHIVERERVENVCSARSDVFVKLELELAGYDDLGSHCRSCGRVTVDQVWFVGRVRRRIVVVVVRCICSSNNKRCREEELLNSPLSFLLGYSQLDKSSGLDSVRSLDGCRWRFHEVRR